MTTQAEQFINALQELRLTKPSLEDFLISARQLPTLLTPDKKLEHIYNEAREINNTSYDTLVDWSKSLTPWLIAFNEYRLNESKPNSPRWIDHSILSEPPGVISFMPEEFIDAVNTSLSPKAKIEYIVYLRNTQIQVSNVIWGRKKYVPLLGPELLGQTPELLLTKQEAATVSLSKKAAFLSLLPEHTAISLVKNWYGLPSTVIELYKHLIPYPTQLQETIKWWESLITTNTRRINVVEANIELPTFD